LKILQQYFVTIAKRAQVVVALSWILVQHPRGALIVCTDVSGRKGNQDGPSRVFPRSGKQMTTYAQLRRLSPFRGGLFANETTAHARGSTRGYRPVWAVLADHVRRSGARSVIEIGCGAGEFAGLLRDLGIADYVGLDTNAARLARARVACPEYRFEVADVFLTSHLRSEDYDVAVMTGFLEFVRWDLVALELVRPNRRVLGTVTAGDDPGRVRQFTSATQVLDHYSPVLRELRVEPVHLPHGRTAFLFDGIK
jgi:SAM-dependent methyltransferase